MIYEMSKEKRPVIIPVACFCHDDKEYSIDFELPGVDKDHIELTVSAQGVCLAGSRDDAEFAGCWSLAHEVDDTRAEAEYANGLLRVRIPIKTMAKETKVEIK
jgi:HSP20 family protein